VTNGANINNDHSM